MTSPSLVWPMPEGAATRMREKAPVETMASAMDRLSGLVRASCWAAKRARLSRVLKRLLITERKWLHCCSTLPRRSRMTRSSTTLFSWRMKMKIQADR